ncbi:hypothetical protein BX286_0053 [Streptomyces sp. 3211.6]|nr:hypothetical protein BX286_0053 [Streptomyces sp. 3211.6]
MTDAEFDPSGEQAVSSELAGVMPVDYVAFHSQNHVAYLEYAHLELGPEAVPSVVEDVFTFLLEVWPDALKEANLQAFAWAQLQARRVRPHRGRAVARDPRVPARRGRRRGLRRRLHRRRGLHHPVRRQPHRPRRPRVGGLPRSRTRLRRRQGPPGPTQPRRPPRPPRPPPHGGLHPPHHHQPRGAVRRTRHPRPRRALGRPPGVRPGHGVRGRADSHRHRPRVRGPLPPDPRPPTPSSSHRPHGSCATKQSPSSWPSSSEAATRPHPSRRASPAS